MQDGEARRDRPARSGRRITRRGVLAGLAAAPLALEIGRAASTTAAAPLPAHPGSGLPGEAGGVLANILAQGGGRIVISTSPPLEESRLAALEGLITPTSLHFIRNHTAHPTIDVATWRLAVEGEVDRPLLLSYDELRALPSVSLNVTLECAGNSRSRFSPQAQGTQWGNGAVSTAEWTGVPLGTVLELAGMRGNVVQVIARGGDAVNLTRGLPAEYALRPDTLLAWAMNGETLPIEHGFPLRLVVPGWIGVANVKWVERITASPVPHEGQHQTVNYVYYREGRPDEPATLLPVKSVIARPEAGGTVGGPVVVSGFAWSGNGRIIAVDVSPDGGQSWAPARLHEPIEARHWVRWSLPWQPPAAGSYTLMSKATDETGATQAMTAEWNRLGYSYNAILPVQVDVAAPGTQAAVTPAGPAEPPAVEPPPTDGEPVVAGAGAGGQDVYAAACASCHGADGQGTNRGPQLVGDTSAVRSIERDALLNYVKQTMPLNDPGSLTDVQYRAVVDFLRQANGLP